MKILILNWRDIKDPRGGGAEVLTHELAKRFVKAGYEVIQHSSIYPGGEKEELIDGARIVRHGNYITTYIYSFLAVLLRKEKFDLILEEVHGIPYFTPLITKKKVIVLALEIANKHWSLIYPFPMNLLGRLLERLYFALYKNLEFLTISPSSKNELIREGITEKNITILPMGLSIDLPNKLPPKEKNPTLVFLGRITPIKGIEDAIEVTKLIKKDIANIQLWVIGHGDEGYVKQTKRKVRSLGLQGNVKFWGFVSQKEKFKLLAKTHILLAPSRNEGWGLIVPEAAMVRTPSVVYNVNGLRDLVISGKTGIVTKQNNPSEMALETESLLKDQRLYKRISEQAYEYAKTFSWDNTAKVVLKVLFDSIRTNGKD